MRYFLPPDIDQWSITSFQECSPKPKSRARYCLPSDFDDSSVSLSNHSFSLRSITSFGTDVSMSSFIPDDVSCLSYSSDEDSLLVGETHIDEHYFSDSDDESSLQPPTQVVVPPPLRRSTRRRKKPLRFCDEYERYYNN